MIAFKYCGVIGSRVMSPEKVSGIEAITADAITFKTLPAPLTPAQLSELIQIPPRP